ALVEDLLKPVAVSGQSAHHPSVQRRAFGEAAQVLEELLAEPLLVSGQLLRRFQGLVGGTPACERFVGLLLEIAAEHLPWWPARVLRRKHSQVLGRE